MPRIAVGIEYDGAAYAGWQTQAGLPTVQARVEAALSRVAASPVAVVCAGRTDSGVHAREQVAHFDTQARRSSRGWALGANAHLPADICVAWARPVPDHFHARYSAEARTYRYFIVNRGTRSALAAHRAYWVHHPLDVGRMREALPGLLGEHDFSGFRAAECQARSPIRRMLQLDVSRTGDMVVIAATANAFLHHMMRNIVGLLIAIGRGDRPPEAAREVLESRDRQRSAATAPPEGLYFWSVRYPAAFQLPSSADGAGVPERSVIMPPLPQ
jgi:tRNA pseudouridine38-40 synthase